MALQPAFDAYHKVEGFLDWLLDTPLDIGEEALRAWRPDWTTERPTSSNPPSWYCSPRRTVGEFLFWNSLFIGLTIYAFTLGPGLKPLDLPKHGKRHVGIMDMVLGVSLSASILLVLWYKWVTNTFVYMLQPCHVVTLMMIYVCFCTERRRAATVFAFFLHANLGTFLALAFPDTGDYWRRNIAPELTIANFFLLHYLLAIAPYCYVWNGDFSFKKGLYAVYLGWLFLGILHWTILLPASLISAQNINYMLSPPKGPTLTIGQEYYRSMQAVVVLPLLLIPGVIIPWCTLTAKRLLAPVLGTGASKGATREARDARPTTRRLSGASPKSKSPGASPKSKSPARGKSPTARRRSAKSGGDGGGGSVSTAAAAAGRDGFAVGVKVEVLLDSGEWSEAVISAGPSTRGRFEIEFGPGDSVWLKLPNAHVRLKRKA